MRCFWLFRPCNTRYTAIAKRAIMEQNIYIPLYPAAVDKMPSKKDPKPNPINAPANKNTQLVVAWLSKKIPIARDKIDGYTTLFSPYWSNHFPVKGLEANKHTAYTTKKKLEACVKPISFA